MGRRLEAKGGPGGWEESLGRGNQRWGGSSHKSEVVGGGTQGEGGPGCRFFPAPSWSPLHLAFPPHSLPPGSHSHLDLAPLPVRKGAHPCMTKTSEDQAGNCWRQEGGTG